MSGRFHPVVVLPPDTVVLDLTRPATPPEARWTIGRYDEDRVIYTQALFSGARTVHMGIDLGGPVGTAVHAFAGGVVLRRASGRRGDGRARLPGLRAALVVTAGLWLGLWRWDAARWRRSHVMVVVDTTSEGLDTLVASLRAEGLDVERWDRSAAADGPRRGVSCRLRDLRRVNSLIDERG